MHIVKEQEFCEKAYPAFSQVFNSDVDRGKDEIRAKVIMSAFSPIKHPSIWAS